MTIFQLLEQACEQHRSFQESMSMNIHQQIHQYALKHPELSKYEVCQQVISEILNDSTGILVDTYLKP
ncbi:MAG: hypothetical protein ACPGTQ_11375 [Colwellia sp.]